MQPFLKLQKLVSSNLHIPISGIWKEAEDAVMDAFIQYWENKDKLEYSNQQYQRIYIYHFKEQMHRLTRIKKISPSKK